jgi:hypothetical protein
MAATTLQTTFAASIIESPIISSKRTNDDVARHDRRGDDDGPNHR